MGENPKLNDKASGVFNLSFGIGCFIAPILGGDLDDVVGFNYTCDIMACASLGFAVVYFFVNILPHWVTKE